MSATIPKKFLSVFMSFVLAVAFIPIVGIVGTPQQAQAAIDEQEPNDAYSDATPISIGAEVYGSISASSVAHYDGNSENASGDQDFYKFVVPQSGNVKLAFINDELDTYSFSKIYIYVMNQYKEFVDEFEVTPNSTREKSKMLSFKKGTHYIRVVAYHYDQSYHFKLTYNVPGTSVKKPVAAKKKFTVKWAKKSGAYKYQVRYSTNKGMSGAKTLNVSKKAASKVVKTGKSKKTYYVQVRVAKKIGGQVYWSKWSSKKSVKTK